MTLKEARAEYFEIAKLANLMEIREKLEAGCDKEEAVEELTKQAEALIRRLEENTHGRHNRSEPMDASGLFSADGELIRDGRLSLRRMCEDDYSLYRWIFMEQEIHPREEAYDRIFRTNLSNENLYCTIFTAAGSVPVGYCGIKYVDEDPAELAVELLKKYHRKGIGYRALSLYMKALEAAGVREYTAMVDSDNIASQKLFEKLGARLAGLTEYMLYTAEERRSFERMYEKLISPRMEELARRLDVAPQRLLSHALRYEISR